MTEVTSLFKKRILHLCKSEQWFKDDSNFHLLADVESVPNILEIINLQVMRAIIGYYISSEGYLDKLKVKNKQLVYRDDYGDLNEKDWEEEIKIFTNNRLEKIQLFLYLKIPAALKAEMEKSPSWNDYYCESFDFIAEAIKDYVDHKIYYDEIENEENSINNKDNSDLINHQLVDTYEYEKLIAETFENHGWTTLNISKNSEQGANIIMQKEGLSYVIQCKLYS